MNKLCFRIRFIFDIQESKQFHVREEKEETRCRNHFSKAGWWRKPRKHVGGLKTRLLLLLLLRWPQAAAKEEIKLAGSASKWMSKKLLSEAGDRKQRRKKERGREEGSSDGSRRQRPSTIKKGSNTCSVRARRMHVAQAAAQDLGTVG